MDIRRVVPMVGHAFGNRHMPADSDLEAVAPVAEIWEADNRLFRHAHEAAQDFFGVLHGLDGLAEHNHVKTLVTEGGQAAFQVGLDDVDAAFYGGLHAGGVDFYAVARALFALGERG